jgi:predicted amidophosphoribosyltransferase
MADWDYSSEYCEACAELGMTICSCEPDGFEEEYFCSNCGADIPSWLGGDICDECQEEEDELFLDDDEN